MGRASTSSIDEIKNQELRHRLLPARRRREQARMVKKSPSRFPQKRSRSGMGRGGFGVTAHAFGSLVRRFVPVMSEKGAGE